MVGSSDDYNEADVAFIQMMIPHHEKAVIMSAKIMRDGKNVFVQSLAREIINSQDEEIERMLQWLRARGLKRDMGSGSSGSM